MFHEIAEAVDEELGRILDMGCHSNFMYRKGVTFQNEVCWWEGALRNKVRRGLSRELFGQCLLNSLARVNTEEWSEREDEPTESPVTPNLATECPGRTKSGGGVSEQSNDFGPHDLVRAL